MTVRKPTNGRFGDETHRNPVILAFATSNLMSAGKWARDRYGKLLRLVA